jgi:hypothetical protein
VLIWVYYSSQIILMGAEVTHSFAKHRGSIKTARIFWPVTNDVCGALSAKLPLARKPFGIGPDMLAIHVDDLPGIPAAEEQRTGFKERIDLFTHHQMVFSCAFRSAPGVFDSRRSMTLLASNASIIAGYQG